MQTANSKFVLRSNLSTTLVAGLAKDSKHTRQMLFQCTCFTTIKKKKKDQNLNGTFYSMY